MVDMHMHTTYSDGDKSLEEVLIKFEYKKLEYISITDHNTCKDYDDKNIRNNKIFSGKIIKGVEMNAEFKGKKICYFIGRHVDNRRYRINGKPQFYQQTDLILNIIKSVT